MERTIISLIEQAIYALYELEHVVFAVEQPKEITHGDYSTNIALVISKQLGKNPKEIAGSIVEYLQQQNTAAIENISIAGAGFINFTLTKEYFAEQLKVMLVQQEQWGSNHSNKGKTILVEHSSPNLFKAFHIGHVMNNAIGESISRLAIFSGADVKNISYPSDISLGIAKAVWILMQDGGMEKLKTLSAPSEIIEYLGDCYVRGTRAYDDTPEIQADIRLIADNMYKEEKNTPEYKVYEDAKALNMAYFKTITATLGSTFDDFIYESEAGEIGKNIVLDNIGRVYTESDGAVIYEGEQDGLHTRVFINKEGNPTYEAKDTGLMELKFDRYQPDISLFITDHQQTEYFKVVATAASKISPQWKDRVNKTIHRTHGRMSFKGQKMSSRLGGVPSAQALLDAIYEELNDRAPDLAKDTDGLANRHIAVGALKFVILRTAPGKDINFDPETSLSFEGDSGPYLQYSTVRARSIIDKAAQTVIEFPDAVPKEWQTTTVEKILIHFPEVVEHAIQEWSPHFIVTYLLELSQAFNSWYGNTKILVDGDDSSPYKVEITKAFAQTMTNGLYLLGISVPEKM